MYRLEKRNNKAYMCMSDIDYTEPRIITMFWRIPVDIDLIPDNAIIEKFNDSFLLITDYRKIGFQVTEYPEFNEFTPIKPPRKTGYKWAWGKWIKA